MRYSADGENFVDVCPLCQDIALEHGWVKEGSPTTPVVNDRRRKRRGLVATLLGESRRPRSSRSWTSRSCAGCPEPELAMVEAADLFNESAFRRTIAGIAKSLGAPKASIVPLSGRTARSSSASPGTSPGTSTASPRTRPSPCAWPSAGHDPRELESMFTSWNAKLTPDGRIAPDISPV